MKTLSQIKSELKPIHTEKEYRDYLGIIDTLVDCEEASHEEEVLELVSMLVEEYESKHYTIKLLAGG